jgi:RNA polymerase sigma factor (sigma-70 family)
LPWRTPSTRRCCITSAACGCRPWRCRWPPSSATSTGPSRCSGPSGRGTAWRPPGRTSSKTSTPWTCPILARYDGQRPLVPWLIRVFQNKHLSELRHRTGVGPLPEDDLGDRDLSAAEDGRERWHDEFRSAARTWLDGLPDNEVLILGLRLRYRLSQREVAHLLGIHEGNVSRQTARLRDHCLEQIGEQLRRLGWTGDDLGGFVLKEMDSLLLDEPRLSADRLAALLAARGKRLPDSPPEEIAAN